jgi:1,4-alpha-glucan branching enzyme
MAPDGGRAADREVAVIKTSRDRDGRTKVTFVVPDAGPPVSVVGDFNRWDASVHRLRRRSNGTRSVAVALGPGRYEYRYLYGDDGWASEPGDGDGNSVVVVEG